jgi:CheY-like chemotaxis protein
MATVLIVEDDVFINMEAVFILQELKYQVHSAHDVDQALAVLHAGTTVDLLFTDIRLKDRHLGGYELAKQAASLRANLRVLYASGSKQADLSSGLVLEGSHFVQKPYDETQLQAALAAALQAAPVRGGTI